jgi:CubicO group peptidase (beta-lactamase class C family)
LPFVPRFAFRALLTLAAAVFLLAGARLRGEYLAYNRFGEYLESLRVQAGIPGLEAAIIGRTAILWERAFGSQDLERNIAARTDTPIHVDGLTETFTAAIILRCVEEGRLSLDDRIGRFKSSHPDANLTLRQVLSHTSGAADNPVFAYRPDRLDSLAPAVRACTGDSYRETLANLLDRTAMIDSVPGPDVVGLAPPAEGVLPASAVARYRGILGRLAVPYGVNAQRKATPAQYSATTLSPATGLISTVRDYAQFDLALRNGIILRTETLAAAWRSPATADGQRLPHGLGWFVQTYNDESLVWQFGTGENGSSSLAITVPTRSITVVLIANSNGLAKGFSLQAGNVTLSPFARAFLGLFVI